MMENTKKLLKINFIGLILIGISILLSVSSMIIIQTTHSGKVLSESVNISSNVYGCQMNLVVEPEERFLDNWTTDVLVKIYDNTNMINYGTFNSSVGIDGKNTINICDLIPPIYIGNNYYNYYIKGKSHLTRGYPNIYSFEKVEDTLNFTNIGQPLLAGDIDNLYDDEINSLDITHIIRILGKIDGVHMEYNDKYDLDFDGDIDIDDAEVLLKNIYLIGDSPI